MHIYSILNIIFIVVLYAMIIQYSIIKAKTKTLQKKLESVNAHNKILTEMLDKLNGFRHDYANFLISLDGYAQTGNVEGFKKMSKTALVECAEVNRIGVLDPKIVKNPAIYSLLTNKYYLAQEQNITMNIEVFDNIAEDSSKSYEICKILGILLDNAIEAAGSTEEKIINIRFQKDCKVKRNLIIVENTYSNKNIDVGKIFDKNYTSKEDLNGEHGLGLWNIKKILKKNEDLNLYTTAGEFFTQQLEIY